MKRKLGLSLAALCLLHVPAKASETSPGLEWISCRFIEARNGGTRGPVKRAEAYFAKQVTTDKVGVYDAQSRSMDFSLNLRSADGMVFYDASNLGRRRTGMVDLLIGRNGRFIQDIFDAQGRFLSRSGACKPSAAQPVSAYRW